MAESPRLSAAVTSTFGPDDRATPVTVDRAPRLASTVALAAVHAALPVIAFVAFYLAAYQAFVKFSPGTLAGLAVPYRLGKQLEFMLYAVTFAVLLPLSLWTAARHVGALERRRIDPGLVACLNLVGVTALVAAARIAVSYAPPILDPSRVTWIRPISVAALGGVILLCAANGVILRYPRFLSGIVVGEATTPALMAVAAVATVVFLPKSVFRPEHGLAAVAVALVLYGIWRRTAGRAAPARWQRKLDVALVVVIGLLVWNVRLPGPRVLEILAYNHNVYLGPINSVYHGATALVDVNPHYGPVLTYFLAGLFHLFPIGYGTFWLISAAFDVVLFVAIYALLRLAGVGQLLAVCAVVAIVLTCVFSQGARGTQFTMNPARSLRLFLPVLAIVALQLRGWQPRPRPAFTWASVAVVAVSSVWAIEVFFYTAVAVLAALACSARIDAPPGRRLLVDRRLLVQLGAGVVVAQLLFAVGTRTASGSWPNWIRYLQYDRAYSTGSVAQRYHWAPFGPGVLLGALYFTVAAALIVVLLWNRDFARRRRDLLFAVCAVEGFGVAFYSYFAGVSELGTLNKMGPVAILVIALLLALLADEGSVAATALRAGVALLAVGCASTYLLAQPRWPTNLTHTALLGGPSAVIDDVRTAADLPVVFRTAPDAVALLRRTTGDSRRALVLMPDAQTTEILMRADKLQLLPFADPYGDKQLRSNVARLTRLASELPIGTQFLSLDAYYRSSAQHTTDDLDASLIEELKRDYVIETAARGPHGLRVYRLAARR
jgi:hypothetical protein